MSQPATLILRASLRARLYRDIEVSSASTLADLAEAIVAAFGFDMDHAYGFYSKLTGKLFDAPRRFEAALVLARNGYINLQQAGSDVWRVALTESGRALARQLGRG